MEALAEGDVYYTALASLGTVGSRQTWDYWVSQIRSDERLPGLVVVTCLFPSYEDFEPFYYAPAADFGKLGVACRIWVDELASSEGGICTVVFLFTALWRTRELILVRPAQEIISAFQDTQDDASLRMVECFSLQQYTRWLSSRKPVLYALNRCLPLGLDFASIIRVAGYMGLLLDEGDADDTL